MEKLPQELWTLIFRLIDDKEFVRKNVSPVCKNWQEIIRSDPLISGRVFLTLKSFKKNYGEKWETFLDSWPVLQTLEMDEELSDVYYLSLRPFMTDVVRFPCLKKIILNFSSTARVGKPLNCSYGAHISMCRMELKPNQGATLDPKAMIEIWINQNCDDPWRDYRQSATHEEVKNWLADFEHIKTLNIKACSFDYDCFKMVLKNLPYVDHIRVQMTNLARLVTALNEENRKFQTLEAYRTSLPSTLSALPIRIPVIDFIRAPSPSLYDDEFYGRRRRLNPRNDPCETLKLRDNQFLCQMHILGDNPCFYNLKHLIIENVPRFLLAGEGNWKENVPKLETVKIHYSDNPDVDWVHVHKIGVPNYLRGFSLFPCLRSLKIFGLKCDEKVFAKRNLWVSIINESFRQETEVEIQFGSGTYPGFYIYKGLNERAALRFFE